MRCITFKIGPGLQLTLTELPDGSIRFDLAGTESLVDIRGLFFDVRSPALLDTLLITGPNITALSIAHGGVTKLGGGVNMNGTGAQPFDIGVGFGTTGVGRDEIHDTSFVLSTNNGTALTLDELAHVDFGVVLGGAAGKAVTFSPAAPNAFDDTTSAREDESTGLLILANDTDADVGDVLVVTAASDPAHGSVTIAPDGRSVIYLSDLNYSGPDSFEYTISDGNGGCDTAHVTVDVIAVADVPSLTVELLLGNAANEVKLRIRANVTDTDGSEFIDRLEFSGLPQGASVIEGNVIDDPGMPGTLIKDVTLVLEKGSNFNFDLAVRAFAKEISNGDQAAATELVEVRTSLFSNTFQAVDQGLWGPGAAIGFHETGFLGIGGTSPISGHFDPPPIPVPNLVPSPVYPLPGPLFVDLDANVKAGFNYDLLVDTGSIDANAPFGTAITTFYNRATDTLLVGPVSAPTFGASFQSTSPTAHLKLDAVFSFSMDVDISLLGVKTIFEDNLSIPETTVRVVELGTDDISFPVPLGAGFTLNFAFPSFNASAGPGTGTVQATVNSNDIIHLEWDLVQAIPEVFAIPGDFLDPITVSGSASIDFLEDVAQDLVDSIADTLEDIFGDIFGDTDVDLGASFNGSIGLLNADLFAALKIIQSLTLDADTLGGSFVFENGTTAGMNFATGTLFQNATSLDGDSDGLIEFGAVLDPVASLRNDTDLGVDIGYDLSLLPIEGSFSVFGQGESFNLTAFHADGRAPAPIPSIGVFDETFDVNFQSQAVNFVV